MTTKRRLIIACTLLLVLVAGGASRALAQSSSSSGLAPTATTTPIGSTTPTTQPNAAADTFAGIVDGGADTPKIVVTSPDGIATPSVSDTSSSGQSTVSINTPKGASNAVLLVLLVSLVAILPGLLLLTTTFPRFLIVLGLTRQGLGLNTTPPNQVLAGLAAFLTLFVMGPVFSKINDTAIQPAIKGELTQGEAIKKGWEPLRDFMLDHTRTSDLAMLYDLTDSTRPEDATKVSPRFVIPAFILSELRAAFMIGFLIWVPFLLIDLIVSTVLASLGMLMMPPVVVSLPVKLALFVLVDGWALLAGSLLRSAGVG
jgi:flagellar biosynthetic protein FliP